MFAIIRKDILKRFLIDEEYWQNEFRIYCEIAEYLLREANIYNTKRAKS